MISIKKYLNSFISVLSLMVISVSGIVLFGNKQYMLIATIGALITCVPFFIRFHRLKHSGREIIVIACMVAICVVGRLVFIAVPHFKPVTAIVIITGLNFGADAGFITGSLTALISNMQHGQGPWTVFQMAVWGLIGFISGVLGNYGISKNKWVISVYAALCGIIYSLIMDVYTTLSIDSAFVMERYIAHITFALPVMIEYAVSNCVFIVLLKNPLDKKLKRVKTKYGIFT